MTTEEIKKAAEKEYLANPDYSVKELVNTFTAGAKFANKIWQEKTRWIPVTERLPKLRKKEYSILTKDDEGNVYINLVHKQVDIDYLSVFTHWREIE